MSSFTNDLIISPQSDSRKWKLIEEFKYRVGSIDSEDEIKVPAEFVTDFASVPRLFWAIFPPWGRYGKAAILHDYLYFSGKRTRKESDLIFKEAMDVLKVSSWKKELMYYAVKYFGYSAWIEHRQRGRYYFNN